MRILDAAGNVRFSSEPLPPAKVNIADLAFFEAHRADPGAGIMISGPLLGRISKIWLLVFSRRLESPDGKFAGVVYGSIEIGEFERIFALAREGSGDVVALRRINGEVIWRFPRGPMTSDVVALDLNEIRKRMADNQQGYYRTVSPVDQVERLYVFLRLHNFPAYIFWGRSTAALSERFSRDMRVSMALAFMLAALMLLLVRAAYRHAAALAAAGALVRQSEERLRYAIDATTEGVWDWQIKTDRCTCSPRYFEMLGYAPERESALSVLVDWLHPDDRANTLPTLGQRLESAGHYEVEFRMRAADGSYKWILSRGKVVERDANGKPARAVGTHADITARKTIELQMQESRWQIEERNRQIQVLNDALTNRALDAEAAVRTKELFLANIGHELRTPLTPIIGFTTLLLQKTDDPAQLDWLNTIKRSAEHLLDIINDMLDITVIEAGKAKIQHAAFELDDVLKDVRALMTERASAAGLAFDVRRAPQIESHLSGDARRLTQILLNLVGNAIKFTDQGSVTLTVSPQPDRGTDRVLKFEVEDTGIGIAPDMQPRLFSNFVQADDSFRRRHGGLGLGLAISRQLVLLMNGEIGFTSTPGRGSTFWFTARFGTAAGEDQAPTAEKTTDDPRARAAGPA